jgi:hypothetical protein
MCQMIFRITHPENFTKFINQCAKRLDNGALLSFGMIST